MDAERSDVGLVSTAPAAVSTSACVSVDVPDGEAHEVGLGRRAESGGERRGGAPVGGIGRRGGELRGEAVRKIEGVGDGPVGGDGDVSGMVPRVGSVVVHRDVHGVARLPVGAGEGHGVAGGVRLLVAVQGRCSGRRRRRWSGCCDGEARACTTGCRRRRDRECPCELGQVEGVGDGAVGGRNDVGLVGPRVALVVVDDDMDGLRPLPSRIPRGPQCRRGRSPTGRSRWRAGLRPQQRLPQRDRQRRVIRRRTRSRAAAGDADAQLLDLNPSPRAPFALPQAASPCRAVEYSSPFATKSTMRGVVTYPPERPGVALLQSAAGGRRVRPLSVR